MILLCSDRTEKTPPVLRCTPLAARTEAIEEPLRRLLDNRTRVLLEES